MTHIDTNSDVHNHIMSHIFQSLTSPSYCHPYSSSIFAEAGPRTGASTTHPAMKLPMKPSFPPPPPLPLTSSSSVCVGGREKEEDILYQWRLRRRLEQAQRATAALTARLGVDGPPLFKSRDGTGYRGMGNWNRDIGTSHMQSLLLDGSVTEGT